MGKEATKGAVIENKYRLERELGAGGMGSVWLATQLMVDRPVAVKLLHPAFEDEKEIQARFEVEAKAIGKLNHPNVITLYDFGYSKDLEAFYTAIEYIDGVSLDKRLHERIPLQEIVEIIRQTALALDHAHHHGILHRDLKPENVMLARMTDGSQMVKVLDFGIARIVKGTYDTESPDSQRITKAGEVFGTPAYMSPEQARSIRRLTPASDLYSLGIMLYELVVGKLPFFAKSAFDLLMLHVTKPVPPIRRPDVPDDLIQIIYRLLEKEPERRFQSGRDLAAALGQLRLPPEPAPVDAGEGTPTLRTQSPFADFHPADDLDPTNEDRPVPYGGQPTLASYETNPAGAPFSLPTPSGEYRQQASGEYRPNGPDPRQGGSGEFRQYGSGEFAQYGSGAYPGSYPQPYASTHASAAVRQGPTQETAIAPPLNRTTLIGLVAIVFLIALLGAAVLSKLWGSRETAPEQPQNPTVRPEIIKELNKPTSPAGTPAPPPQEVPPKAAPAPPEAADTPPAPTGAKAPTEAPAPKAVADSAAVEPPNVETASTASDGKKLTIEDSGGSVPRAERKAALRAKAQELKSSPRPRVNSAPP